MHVEIHIPELSSEPVVGDMRQDRNRLIDDAGNLRRFGLELRSYGFGFFRYRTGNAVLNFNLEFAEFYRLSRTV
ncbi:hypothetical protein [Natronorubrum daqingense]|uniref:hypothetical protein n=1 Tax=Natronorubrum daqingense TaxID=588898 RepID=UPI001115793F|nr:hypothetical protein [Natronorubrum daqingense]